MAAPSLQGATSCQREGGPSGEDIVPATRAASVLVSLVLEAVIGVLQGVPVASTTPV